ncbi:hypothetical protein Hdeb2414_s0007g00246601 [Helianthus debilis subsp. tardiflorus]
MSRTGRSMIRSVLTAKDQESFGETYNIPEHFSPTLPGPNESAKCTPDRIVLYTMAFSSCGVRYPHFSLQDSPIASLRSSFLSIAPSRVYEGGTFRVILCGCLRRARKDSVSKPCYTFMPTSTYPKERKSRFIFVSTAMIPESPPLKDAEAANKDSIPIFSADEIVQWKRMYENPTRAFIFSEGILAMGG